MARGGWAQSLQNCCSGSQWLERREGPLETQATTLSTVPTWPPGLAQGPLPAAPGLPDVKLWGRGSLGKAGTPTARLPMMPPAPHQSCLLPQDPTFKTRNIT